MPFRSAVSNAATTGTQALAVDKPAGLAEGDFLVVFLSASGSGSTFITPSGWTNLDPQRTNGGLHAAWYWKIATAADATGSGWTFASTEEWTAIKALTVAYSSIDPTPIDASAFIAGSTATGVVSLTGIDAASGAFVLAACAINAGPADTIDTGTPPSGFTHRISILQDTNADSALFDDGPVAGGATGDADVTTEGSTHNFVGGVISILPAAGGTGSPYYYMVM